MFAIRLHLFLFFFSSLAHLNVSCCRQLIGDELCEVLLQNQHLKLESLELFRMSGLSELGIDILCRTNLSGLRELDLGWCRSINVATTGCIINLTEAVSKKLEKLSLSGLRQVSDAELIAIGQQLENLTQLDIMGSRFVTFAGVDTLLTKCQNLQLLELSYCEALTDSLALSQLKANYPNCCIVYSHCFNA